ncbi:hypothetical protein [Leisingera daeponensis]|uniref:hypothetical protein n=1 Tax=Leisingera daeponensis TaxID=405746 RepID=UPI001C953F40|nr:hypothetical protein [Leisingera daeponensis]MBY6056761.1 hypothetical protein [Leisingera daeponensis]
MALDNTALQTLLTAMHRMPWRHVASKAIHISGGRPRRGWRNTTEAAAQGGLGDINVSELERLYKEHLLVGEKFSKFYELEDDVANTLKDSLCDLLFQENEYTKAYPFPLSGVELSEVSSELRAIELVQSDDGIGIVYCSKLTVSKREEIILHDWVPNENDREEMLAQFSEVYGLKIERTQLFHVAWIPSDKSILDVRVDFPDGMHEDAAHRIHSAIRKDLEGKLNIKLPPTPIDFMPAIESIYSDKTEGNVVEFGFTTVTNSVKNEKMRQARGGYHCLRQELFHKAGIEALLEISNDEEAPSPITPFRISVQWPVPADENIYVSPELTLATTTRGGGAGSINGVVIRNCLEGAQYLYIRDKLLKHINL